MWATELFVTPAFCEGHGHPSMEGHGRPPVVASQPPDEKACAGHALRTPSGRNDFYRGPAQRLVCAAKAQTAFGACGARCGVAARRVARTWRATGHNFGGRLSRSLAAGACCISASLVLRSERAFAQAARGFRPLKSPLMVSPRKCIRGSVEAVVCRRGRLPRRPCLPPPLEFRRGRI